MAPKTKGGFYAVQKGRNPGVYATWEDCEREIKGFPGAKFKKLTTTEEAQAFVSGNLSGPLDPAPSSSAISSDVKGKKRDFGPEVLDTTGWDVTYSDGACKGNGKIGSIAGVGVWWGPSDPRNIAERCPGDQTNNRAELIAILRVLETTPLTEKPLLIRTDSQYSLQCFNSLIFKWENNNWKTTHGKPVKNDGIIRCISKRLAIRAKSGQKVVLEYVKGHSGDTGNDGADAMANRGALLPAVPERDWKAIETQLERELAEVGTGRKVAELIVLPLDDLPETETPSKVRKVSEDKAAFSTSKHVAKHPPSESPTKIPPKIDHKPLSTVHHTLATPVNHIEQPPSSLPVIQHQDGLDTRPKKPTISIYPHISGAKSPLRVICAYPLSVPVSVEEVNIDDYTDCLLDDSDLANEIF